MTPSLNDSDHLSSIMFRPQCGPAFDERPARSSPDLRGAAPVLVFVASPAPVYNRSLPDGDKVAPSETDRQQQITRHEAEVGESFVVQQSC
jgi:hypothetical protein